MTNYTKVTDAWHRIHDENPWIYGNTKPRFIRRMAYRDFAFLVKKYCKLNEGAIMLEAGCGSARDSLYFSYAGYDCTAVDISASPLDKVEKAAKEISTTRYGNPVKLKTLQADIFNMPDADNTYHFVFSSGVVEHYDVPTRRQLIAEMIRIAKPGGYVCIVFPNKKHILENYWHALISRFAEFDKYDIPEQHLDADFVNGLTDLGLEIILHDWMDSYYTISHYPDWQPLRALAFSATTLLPRPPYSLRKKLGTRGIVIARKK